jgi:hypothetical protein
MPPPSKFLVKEYLTMAKENEAVWALLIVLGVTVFLEFYL